VVGVEGVPDAVGAGGDAKAKAEDLAGADSELLG
jgi:hypothetical protein